MELASMTDLEFRDKVMMIASNHLPRQTLFTKHGSFKRFIPLLQEPKHLSIYGRYTSHNKMCKLDAQLLLGHSVLGFSSSKLRKCLESLRQEWRKWKLPKFKRGSGPPLIAIILGHYVPVVISKLSRSVPEDIDEPWKYVLTIREFLMEALTDEDRRLFDSTAPLQFWSEPSTDDFEEGSIMEFIGDMTSSCDSPPSSWKSSCRSYIEKVEQGTDTLPRYASTCFGTIRGIAGIEDPIFDSSLTEYEHRSYSEKILDGLRDKTCSATMKLKYLCNFKRAFVTDDKIYVGQILHEILCFESTRRHAEKTLKIRKRILDPDNLHSANIASNETGSPIDTIGHTVGEVIKDRSHAPKVPQTIMALQSSERPINTTRYLKLQIPKHFSVRAFRKFLRCQEGITSSFELMRKTADYYTGRLQITGERKLVRKLCKGDAWPLLEHGKIFSEAYTGDFYKPIKLEKNRLGGTISITLTRIENLLADLWNDKSVPEKLILHARYRLLSAIRAGKVIRPKFRRFIREVDATTSGIKIKAKSGAFLPKEAIDSEQLNEILEHVLFQFKNWIKISDDRLKPPGTKIAEDIVDAEDLVDKCDFSVLPTTEWLLENTNPISGAVIGALPTSSNLQAPGIDQAAPYRPRSNTILQACPEENP